MGGIDFREEADKNKENGIVSLYCINDSLIAPLQAIFMKYGNFRHKRIHYFLKKKKKHLTAKAETVIISTNI